jgi:hypothetical protein
MTQFADLFAALAAPFAPQEVKTRSQAGRQFYYVTARTVMNRLDAVLGPENWWDEYIPNANSVLCRLSVRLPDGQILTKADAGGYAGMSDQGDDDKSGYSDAFKRAAVKFGLARYLYRDGVPEFVRERVLGQPAQTQGESRPAAEEPAPAMALSAAAEPESAPAPAPAPVRGSGRLREAAEPVLASVPRNGRAMFAWVKEQEQKHEVALLKYLNNWGKLQEFPSRMVDWDADQVAQAHAEASRKLRSLHPDREEEEAEALAN